MLLIISGLFSFLQGKTYWLELIQIYFVSALVFLIIFLIKSFRYKNGLIYKVSFDYDKLSIVEGNKRKLEIP